MLSPKKLLFRRIKLIVYLAWRDLLAEKTLALCIISGLASTLLPMLLLAGLKAGLINHLRENLLHEPQAREISSARNSPYPEKLLQTLKHDKDVAFLIPKTRTLAASVRLQPQKTDSVFEGTDAELIPTAAGDPLLGQEISKRLIEQSQHRDSLTVPVVLSAHLAEHMHLHSNDDLAMLIGRHGTNIAKTARIDLKITAIAPETATARYQVFVPLSVAQAAEEWRENTNLSSWQEALALGMQKENNFFAMHDTATTWPGFRLYTKTLSGVMVLDKKLTQEDLSISDELSRVKTILDIDKQTTSLFHLMAYIGIIGFTITLGTAIAAETERKKFHLASLRFLGVNNTTVLPIVQAIILGTSGTCLAFCTAWCLAWPTNHIFHHSVLQESASAPAIVITISFALQLLSYIIPGTIVMAWVTTRFLRHVSPWQGICNT